jgi:short-subunit dehydrogenase
MEKVVFVTGVSSGFGKVIAEYLYSKGFVVYGTSRKGNTSTKPFPYQVLKMDVKDSNSVSEAVSHIVKEQRSIDVLINNAGISISSSLEESSDEDIQNIMDTNLYGAMRTCRAVLPHMRKNKSGLIINIGSIAGLMGLPFMGLYSTSKFALEGFTESLSLEVQSFGIKVCIVEPGDFYTQILENRKLRKPQDSSYISFFETVITSSEQKMKSAPSPDPMGPFIYKIINTKKLKLRYKIGSFVEKLSPVVKTIVSGRMFEKIMLSYYK